MIEVKDQKSVNLTSLSDWKRFVEYCKELGYARLVIKVDVFGGHPTQFEILEEHRKFRSTFKPNGK